MTQPPSGSAAHGDRGDGRPGDDRPSAGWPDDDGPDDDWSGEQWPDDDWPSDQPAAWSAAPPPPGDVGVLAWLHANVLAVALIAVIAGVAGAFAAFLLTQGPSAAPGPSRTPSGALPSIPGQRIGGGNAVGGVPGGTGGQLQMLLAGKVTAVSSTSITVEGHGNSVTGTVTSATTVTGKVTGIGGVKVGDQVLVKFTGTAGSGTLTAVTIQDPASIS
jgi:hypothetical protein